MDLIPVLMVAEQLAQSMLWIRGFVTVVAEFEGTLDVALLVVVAGAITSATPRHKTLSPNMEVRTVYISNGMWRPPPFRLNKTFVDERRTLLWARRCIGKIQLRRNPPCEEQRCLNCRLEPNASDKIVPD